MPYHCVAKIERALNNTGRAVKGSRILLLGVSYKGGVGDIRESPALRIIEVLKDYGAQLSYHDPHVPSLPDLGLENTPLDTAIENTDAVVLVTAHPGIDHGQIATQASLFVDLRGITRGTRAENVVRL
jgi:UDP-N-acetyl-D-glucosamine dehydrogenase